MAPWYARPPNPPGCRAPPRANWKGRQLRDSSTQVEPGDAGNLGGRTEIGVQVEPEDIMTPAEWEFFEPEAWAYYTRVMGARPQPEDSSVDVGNITNDSSSGNIENDNGNGDEEDIEGSSNSGHEGDNEHSDASTRTPTPASHKEEEQGDSSSSSWADSDVEEPPAKRQATDTTAAAGGR